MTNVRALLIGTLAAALALPCAGAPRRTESARLFGVVGHVQSAGADDDALSYAIARHADPALAFLVVIGIKRFDEPCSDALYQRRRDLFDQARSPVIVSIAASDWSECVNASGRPAAQERLNRLRELLFSDAASLGTRKLALQRLSTITKFRSYAENAHWEAGRVLYATVNLPSNNNHYRPEAGRNNEFEDRMVANRAWLQRLFALAARGRLDGLVLFSDADMGALPEHAPEANRAAGVGYGRDGMAEIRRQVLALAKKYSGKVLLVDAATARDGAARIKWHGNLGHVSVGTSTLEVRVTPGAVPMFAIKDRVDGQ